MGCGHLGASLKPRNSGGSKIIAQEAVNILFCSSYVLNSLGVSLDPTECLKHKEKQIFKLFLKEIS